MSLACLLSVALEIEFRGKRGVGVRTIGAEMSSRASSYFVYIYFMEGEFEQIITKQGQKQLTAE